MIKENLIINLGKQSNQMTIYHFVWGPNIDSIQNGLRMGRHGFLLVRWDQSLQYFLGRKIAQGPPRLTLLLCHCNCLAWCRWYTVATIIATATTADTTAATTTTASSARSIECLHRQKNEAWGFEFVSWTLAWTNSQNHLHAGTGLVVWKLSEHHVYIWYDQVWRPWALAQCLVWGPGTSSTHQMTKWSDMCPTGIGSLLGTGSIQQVNTLLTSNISPLLCPWSTHQVNTWYDQVIRGPSSALA